MGCDEYGRLDTLTVSLPHPEAMQEMTSGQSEITGHFATPPFMNAELKNPKIHTILNSFDVWGGPQTATITWTTTKFARENPKLLQAFAAALEDATQRINSDKRKAAQLYTDMSKDQSGVDAIYAIIADPQMKFTTVPDNIIKFTDFKQRTGGRLMNLMTSDEYPAYQRRFSRPTRKSGNSRRQAVRAVPRSRCRCCPRS